MGAITTHVLDTSRGRPAAGVRVVLQYDVRNEWQVVGRGATDADGRLRTLMPDSTPAAPGVYRLVFDTQAYFESQGVRTFYPHVVVTFEIVDGDAHYHVPLLLSPYGYTTYRGT
jgi:5-hydroxyisourate hydrolase